MASSTGNQPSDEQWDPGQGHSFASFPGNPSTSGGIWTLNQYEDDMVRDESIDDLHRGDLVSQFQSTSNVLPEVPSHADGENFRADYFHSHGLPSASNKAQMNRSEIVVPESSHESLVGKPDYPSPRPHVEPKARFTPEDDILLKQLKGRTAASWKQIAEFFPGRASGTLQVRYCVKLKPREETLWNDKAIAKLLKKIQIHENKKWYDIAKSLGPQFTAEECREKAIQLNAAYGVDDDDEGEDHGSQQQSDEISADDWHQNTMYRQPDISKWSRLP